MKDAGRAERRRWSGRVLEQLEEQLGPLGGHTFEIHASADYCDWGVVSGLKEAGAVVIRPMAGLTFGQQLAEYTAGRCGDTASPPREPSARRSPGRLTSTVARAAVTPDEGGRREAIMRFHLLLGDLADRLGGARQLAEVTGRSGWPAGGVYFFSEPGEVREGGGTRVVRVGTHALTATSKTSLWTRLRTHRGAGHGGGSHRSSIFRLHVGTAMLARGRHPEAAATWGKGNRASAEVRDVEQDLERAVSDYIGRMPFLWLPVDDRHDRAVIEQGSFALLSNHGRPPIDPASRGWLGHDADRDKIRSSHLWNVNHTGDSWNPASLRRFEALVRTV